jgi:hypothetical protein
MQNGDIKQAIRINFEKARKLVFQPEYGLFFRRRR